MGREVNEEELKREIPKNLINWYPFTQGERVLYIGKKEDAYAEALLQCGTNVSIVDIHEIKKESCGQTKGFYDAIVCIAYLEQEENPEELLTLLVKMIKPRGHLLLGMNNRLGIRYFCGDRDLYTNRNFDGIEGYKRTYMKQEDAFRGRTYSKEELSEIIKAAGWKQTKFYSVFSDLYHPALLVAENCKINADDLYALIPTYNNSETLFLEEENLYQTFIKEDMMHQTANAFLIDCTIEDGFSDALWIKTAVDSKRENAFVTILHEGNVLEKHAVYSEGQEALSDLMKYSQMLRERGISTLDDSLENAVYKVNLEYERNTSSVKECEILEEKSQNAYVLPYQTGVTYLKGLMRTDKDKFLQELDIFRDLIFQSSKVIKEDRNDGKGAILEYGFLNLTPENCYYMDGKFVFWNQEFCIENYPANVLLFRMIRCLYQGDMGMSKYLPMDTLMERYGLAEKKELWWRAEWWFLYWNKNRHVMWKYYKEIQKDANVLNSNRQRMNYNTDDYQRLFVDIFKNADTRKLILFGSGLFTKKFLTLYKDSYPVYAIIDNNSSKWGEEIEGISIYSPEILKEFKSGEYKVIICIKNYLSVMKQLDELGVGDYGIYDWNKDYPRRLNPIAEKTDVDEEISKKYNIGYVAGVFDMFHVGHINLLRRAKEMCNYLIVGVLQDETVHHQKGKYPLISCEDRVEVLQSCRYVDQVEVLPLDYADISDAYRLFQFDCQFSGDDHGEEEYWIKAKEFLNSKGAEIVFFKYTEKVSSTMLREQLKEDKE